MVVNQEGVESEAIEANGLEIQLPATWVHMLCYLYILQYVNTKFTAWLSSVPGQALCSTQTLAQSPTYFYHMVYV